MKQNRSRILKIAIACIAVMYILSPVIARYSQGIQRKNKGKIVDVNVDSRVGLWKRNWQSFTDNPWVGIGFSAVEIDTGENFNNMSNNGQVEPGSSWLAVLSMTGVWGGMAVLLVLLQSYQQLRIIYRNNVHVAAILYGLFAFYAVHMCAEGYIFAGGAMSCLNFWLLLGTIEAYAADGYSVLNVEKDSARLTPLGLWKEQQLGKSFFMPRGWQDFKRTLLFGRC